MFNIKNFIKLCLTVLCLYFSPAWSSEAASFDAESSDLTIPCVDISGSYISAVLHFSNGVFTVKETREINNAVPACSFYDASFTNIYLPIVDVNGQNFWAVINVSSTSPLEFSLLDAGQALTMPADQMSSMDKSCYDNFKQYQNIKFAPEADLGTLISLMDQSNSYCQVAAAYLYSNYRDYNINGNNQEENLTSAYDYALLSASQGNQIGQQVLGDIYYLGDGIDEEFGRAYIWWLLSANQGFVYAQAQLGELFLYGMDNFEMAFYWTQLAAVNGDAGAQNLLGEIYYFGEGVDASASTAAQWWQLAAEQGNPYSQNNLAWLYEEGIGVSKDLELSCQLYTLAVENGLSAAAEAKERVCP